MILDNLRKKFNPWNRNGNNKHVRNHEKTEYETGPPDLYDILKKFSKRINEFFKRKKRSTKHKYNYYIGIIIAILIVTWIGSGFYTIKEAERGVVLRFGKFHHIVEPGLNWKPNFIDTVINVNVESVRELTASGIMLTSDENVVQVEMNVQYRVIDPECYLFQVTDADDSLQQATDSALRGVIGKYTMDRILTEGRTLVRNDTQRVLEETIQPYNMGIMLLDVNFQTARPPEEVKESFDDAIAARENEQQYIREAEAYANEVQPIANGKAQRILEEGKAYKIRTILKAQGEVQQFMKILPEYKIAPEIIKSRLYIHTMENVLGNARKIIIDSNRNNLTIIPLEIFEKNNSIANLKQLSSNSFMTDINQIAHNANKFTIDSNNKNTSSASLARRTNKSNNKLFNTRCIDIKRNNFIQKKSEIRSKIDA